MVFIQLFGISGVPPDADHGKAANTKTGTIKRQDIELPLNPLKIRSL